MRRLSIVVVLCLASHALADEKAIVHRAMLDYYGGERMASVGFGFAGVSTLAAGGVLLAQPDDLPRFTGIPVAFFGLVEAAAAMVLAIRTPGERDRLDAMFTNDYAGFLSFERAHMKRIQRNQVILAVVEAVLTAVGGGLALAGALSHSPKLEGIGIGLGAQALTFFALDLAVWDRANGYAAVLESTGTP